jgi:hypothetical protein
MKRIVVGAVVGAALVVAAAAAGVVELGSSDGGPQAYVISCSPTTPKSSTLYPGSWNFYPHAFDGSLAAARSFVAGHPGCWQVVSGPGSGAKPKKPEPTTTPTTTGGARTVLSGDRRRPVVDIARFRSSLP